MNYKKSKRILNYYEFIKMALYDKKNGYYVKKNQRIGRCHLNSDFYTASSLGIIFYQLVFEATKTLLKNNNLENINVFTEIGVEFNQDQFFTHQKLFKQSIVIKLNESLAKIPKDTIVFANELLDAQPFHRLCFTRGKWHELGVQIQNKNKNQKIIKNIKLSHFSFEMRNILHKLPNNIQEGYILDIPIGAEILLKKIIAQNWKGLIILFDYGKSWEELCSLCPNGTGRSYFRHNQLNNLLIKPGEHDITCYVCWDSLEEILKENDFKFIKLKTQEAFFMHYSQNIIKKVISNNSENFNVQRQTLLELIHPEKMGRKFQVLYGIRE